MNRMIIRLRWLSVACLFGCVTLIASCRHSSQNETPHAHHTDESVSGTFSRPFKGANAIQNEMFYLQESMQQILMLISNNRLSEIPAALEAVHEARALTEKSIDAHGYKPPRNGDRMDEFVQMDGAFHAELEKLVETAAQNRLDLASRQYGQVIQTCTACHQTFRFP